MAKRLMEIEYKYEETDLSLQNLMNQKDSLHQAYNEEIRRMQQNARDRFKKIINEHEHLKSKLDNQRKELEMRGKELEKREAKNESKRRKLAEEKKENVFRNSSLQMASMEQKTADENVLKLAEDQKREKQDLHKRILHLEKLLDAKQAVELEIKLLRLRDKINVMQHMGGDEDKDVKEKGLKDSPSRAFLYWCEKEWESSTLNQSSLLARGRILLMKQMKSL